MKESNQILKLGEKKEAVRSHMSALEERFPLHTQNENAIINTGEEYAALHPETTVPFTGLAETSVDGFPIYISRNSEGVLEATFRENTHALIIGSTGSGKTTGFVLPFINWMCRKKNKPTIIISDPKDELIRQTGDLFVKNGYDIKHFDFKDYTVSDCWNPLTKIFRHYMDYNNVSDGISVVHENGKAYNCFRGKTFKDQSELDFAIEEEKCRVIAEVDAMIGSLAQAVSPVEKQEDPYWDDISSTWIRGFLWAMLEDSAPSKLSGRITEDTFNFDTLIKIFDSFSDNGRKIDDHGYFTSRDKETSKAYQLVVPGIIELSADSTRSCIISCFMEKIKRFRDTSIRKITCANTLDIDRIDDSEKPCAIFISFKDEDSLHYRVISMFISDLYTSLIGASRRNGGMLKRPCYFLLDEFGNFPKFNDFEHVISACRSRNIWFMLIIQSYSQLNREYGKETADIIVDNLNMHMFYGSGNFETKAAFSKECGMHEVTSSMSAINGNRTSIEHFYHELVPLVPISKLNELKTGECIITQLGENVLHSRIERSYLCPEYNHTECNIYKRPSPVSFSDPRYSYNPEHRAAKASGNKKIIDLFGD